jgi:ParB family chromosome partitioning protein
MSKTVAVVNHEYRTLPVAQLQESPTNPRRKFDEHSLAELAASFATQGILQPLLVREIEENKYEVVAGARRLRAAKLAALEEIPARIVALSDIEVLECQLVENGQRENVHPMEEGFAYKAMLAAEGAHYDIARISAKIGRNQSYVATRLRLTELIPSIAEAFLADQIGTGHALEIAKLPASEQQRAFDAAFRTVWSGSKESRVLLPVRELTAWIEQNILLSLETMPFDKNDETLVPEAGSCTNCPKRTGYNTLLFDAALKDSCTDGNCYNNKLSKFVEKQIADKPKLVQITTAYRNDPEQIVAGSQKHLP